MWTELGLSLKAQGNMWSDLVYSIHKWNALTAACGYDSPKNNTGCIAHVKNLDRAFTAGST